MQICAKGFVSIISKCSTNASVRTAQFKVPLAESALPFAMSSELLAQFFDDVAQLGAKYKALAEGMPATAEVGGNGRRKRGPNKIKDPNKPSKPAARARRCEVHHTDSTPPCLSTCRHCLFSA